MFLVETLPSQPSKGVLGMAVSSLGKGIGSGGGEGDEGGEGAATASRTMRVSLNSLSISRHHYHKSVQLKESMWGGVLAEDNSHSSSASASALASTSATSTRTSTPPPLPTPPVSSTSSSFQSTSDACLSFKFFLPVAGNSEEDEVELLAQFDSTEEMLALEEQLCRIVEDFRLRSSSIVKMYLTVLKNLIEERVAIEMELVNKKFFARRKGGRDGMPQDREESFSGGEEKNLELHLKWASNWIYMPWSNTQWSSIMGIDIGITAASAAEAVHKCSSGSTDAFESSFQQQSKQQYQQQQQETQSPGLKVTRESNNTNPHTHVMLDAQEMGFWRIPIPRMRILLLAVGTRGDVDPFLQLGIRLLEDGHRVRLSTHACYRDLVISSGLEYYPLAGDPHALSSFMVKTQGRIFYPSSDTLKEGPSHISMVSDIIHSCWEACYMPDPENEGNVASAASVSSASAANDKDMPSTPLVVSAFLPDAIISNPVTYGHIHCAEALGIPLHLMFPQPWIPTKAFPHPLSCLPYNTGWSPENFLSYQLVDRMLWVGLEATINALRTQKMGLAAIGVGEGGWNMLNNHKVPFAKMWSPHLVPKPKDWPPYVDIVGTFVDAPINSRNKKESALAAAASAAGNSTSVKADAVKTSAAIPVSPSAFIAAETKSESLVIGDVGEGGGEGGRGAEEDEEDDGNEEFVVTFNSLTSTSVVAEGDEAQKTKVQAETAANEAEDAGEETEGKASDTKLPWASSPPSSELIEFLQSGPPPIFVGFGSMVSDDALAIIQLLLEGAAVAGIRVLVQAGWSAVTPEKFKELAEAAQQSARLIREAEACGCGDESEIFPNDEAEVSGASSSSSSHAKQQTKTKGTTSTWFKQMGQVLGSAAAVFTAQSDSRSKSALTKVGKDEAASVAVATAEVFEWEGSFSVASNDFAWSATQDAFLTGPCPHSWLFKQVAAVVHHGGAGTTAAGLRAGRPTWICPFFGDQPFWGEVVHRQGLGPAPCPVSKLSLPIVEESFRILQSTQMQAKAHEMSLKLAEEDGAKNAVKVFYNCLPLHDQLCQISIFLGEARLAQVYCIDCSLRMTVEASNMIHIGPLSRHILTPCSHVDWAAQGPQSCAEGVYQGAIGLVREVAGGVADAIYQPVKGCMENGLQGGGVGVLTGLKSLVAGPVLGGAVLANKVRAGIRSSLALPVRDREVDWELTLRLGGGPVGQKKRFDDAITIAAGSERQKPKRLDISSLRPSLGNLHLNEGDDREIDHQEAIFGSSFSSHSSDTFGSPVHIDDEERGIEVIGGGGTDPIVAADMPSESIIFSTTNHHQQNEVGGEGMRQEKQNKEGEEDEEEEEVEGKGEGEEESPLLIKRRERARAFQVAFGVSAAIKGLLKDFAIAEQEEVLNRGITLCALTRRLRSQIEALEEIKRQDNEEAFVDYSETSPVSDDGIPPLSHLPAESDNILARRLGRILARGRPFVSFLDLVSGSHMKTHTDSRKYKNSTL